MLFDYPEQETYKLPETFPVAAKTAWDIVPEEKAMFLSSTERRTCSKCGVHNGICVCVCMPCRFTKVTGNVLSIWFVYVLSVQKSMEMF